MIYADANATLPATKEHLADVVGRIENVGNPSSSHQMGRRAHVLLTESRLAVAKSLSCDVSEVVFVSGATEANNIGTAGVLRGLGLPLKDCHIVASAIEHPSIREPIEFLERTEGLQVSWVPVNECGLFKTSDVISNLRSNTVLVTLMSANNELGTCEPVQEFCDWLHQVRWAKTFLSDLPLSGFLHPAVTQASLQKLHMHCDGVQSYGKLPTQSWTSLGQDSISCSAHKMGGLSGIGALILRKGRRYQPLVLGGAQERSRRAGTEICLVL